MSHLDPRIEVVANKKLVGMRDSILHSEKFKIGQLWKRFMPLHSTIPNTINKHHIAVQQYDAPIDPSTPFEIWATVEVSEVENIPNGMNYINIPEGTYAIFTLKGMDIVGLYQDIMTKWLPNSGFTIDNRPHFQVMDQRYKNGSQDSEEDVYLPVARVQ